MGADRHGGTVEVQGRAEIIGQRADVAASPKGETHIRAFLRHRLGNHRIAAGGRNGPCGLGIAGHVVRLRGIEHGGQIRRFALAAVVKLHPGCTLALDHSAVAAADGVVQHHGKAEVAVLLSDDLAVVDQRDLDGHLIHIRGEVELPLGVGIVLAGDGGAVFGVVVHRSHILQRAGAAHGQFCRPRGLVHGDIGGLKGEVAGLLLLVVLDGNCQSVGGIIQFAALAGTDTQSQQLHVFRLVVIHGQNPDFLDRLALGEGHGEFIGAVRGDLVLLGVQNAEALLRVALQILRNGGQVVIVRHIHLAFVRGRAIALAAHGVDAADVAEFQNIVVHIQRLFSAHVAPHTVGILGLPEVLARRDAQGQDRVTVDRIALLVHGVRLHYLGGDRCRILRGQRLDILAVGLICRDGQRVLHHHHIVIEAGRRRSGVAPVIHLGENGSHCHGNVCLADRASKTIDFDAFLAVTLSGGQLAVFEDEGSVREFSLPILLDDVPVFICQYQRAVIILDDSSQCRCHQLRAEHQNQKQ